MLNLLMMLSTDQIPVTPMFKCFKQNVKIQNIYEEKRVCNENMFNDILKH